MKVYKPRKIVFLQPKKNCFSGTPKTFSLIQERLFLRATLKFHFANFAFDTENSDGLVNGHIKISMMIIIKR